MSFELMGLISVAVGIACFVYGPSLASYALLSFTLLGASAAAKIAGANLQPAHVLLGFLIIDLASRPRLFVAAVGSVAPFGAGFWLLATVCYAVPASIILPRLFEGATYVFSLGGSDAGTATILQIPLAPVAANITQSLYFAGDLLAFMIFSAYVMRPRGLDAVSSAVVFCALLNIAFAAADVITFYTGTAGLLSFIRNASYRLLTDVQVAGFKRIVGSFAEASSFAYFTVGLFAYTFTLWSRGVDPRRTGIATLGSLCALTFSTSSSGYLALMLVAVLQYLSSSIRFVLGRAHKNAATFVLCGPLILATMLLLLVLHPPTRDAFEHLVGLTLLEKIESDSGVERSSWNAQAIGAFWDTLGFGAGVGSVRASSWLIVVPASIGVFGALAYWLFVGAVLVAPTGREPREIAIRTAAKMGCIAQLIAASIAGGTVDLGLLFFVLAAVAASRATARERVFVPRPAGDAFGSRRATPLQDGA